jgi:ligand-binding sensor domain-containing protein
MEPEELAEAAIALLAQGVNGGIWVKDLAGKPMWMAEDILESA